MNRRSVIMVGGIVGGMAISDTFAQGETSFWAEHQSCDSLFFRPADSAPPALAGTAAPLDKEIRNAFRILWGLPRGITPYELAKVIASIGDKNEDGHKYIQEWPSRANPIIINFFAMTQTLPSGDTTPWCAAFMNFCLFAGDVVGTSSAASASFRTFGAETNVPAEGDIVVFQNKQNAGLGHVGFYVRHSGSDLVVLGGNQSDGIKESVFSTDGTRLKFLSFRKYT